MNEPRTNRLAGELSLYLQQHARNPVDWRPWGTEAFAVAVAEDKPVFLSIGYAACHWCHVMEQECFSDLAVARALNEHCICVKVDRQERPDIDLVYMTASQLMTGRGGWPLNALLTPAGIPFFIGTYLPRDSRIGVTGLLELIPRVGDLWKTQRQEILQSAERVDSALRQACREDGSGPTGIHFDMNPVDGPRIGPDMALAAYEEFLAEFDSVWGGFGVAPKFPSACALLFLLEWHARTASSHALNMVELTLTSMLRGGIFDQLGYGFHRYAIDQSWRVPHFEKMLTDQALLALTYTEAAALTGRPDFRLAAARVLEYVLENLRDGQGGFYSAEDADSDGEEGRYYLFSIDDFYSILGDDAELAAAWYGVEREGNISDVTSGTNKGANVLLQPNRAGDFARARDLTRGALTEKLEAIRLTLLNARATRPRPLLDDTQLTDWNGLMVAALARTAVVLDRPDFLDAADRCAAFLLTRMRHQDDPRALLHRARNSMAGVPAFLDDYAFLIWGLFELHEAGRTSYLKDAEALNDLLHERFWDQQSAGYYFTASNSLDVPFRPKVLRDNATPSGNAVSLRNQYRLARLLGRSDLHDRAEKVRRVFRPAVALHPSGHAAMLLATLEAERHADGA